LIRDRDDKFGTAFDALGRATGIRIIRTAVRAPDMTLSANAFSVPCVANASTTSWCSTIGTSRASSLSTSATTTAPALIKGFAN
jgi:hypothetical protein